MLSEMVMDERFLHYLWKFQKFDAQELKTAEGNVILVFNPGLHNHHSGPDFSEARIKIDGMEWVGHVEIHVKSSDWLTHGHQKDMAYENVILHVVFNNDEQIFRQDKSPIPTLELKEKIDPDLINKYKQLIHKPSDIPCSDHINEVDELILSSVLDKMLSIRLEEKSNLIFQQLSNCLNDWEEVTHRMVCKSFGMKTNAAYFETLANSLPEKILRKHENNPLQIEALIFGMAGFLEAKPIDDYQHQLTGEFQYLVKKYNLEQLLSKSHWKFSRLRPANFPTVRLSQLAAIFHGKNSFSHRLTQSEDLTEIANYLKRKPSPYWQKHYDFGKPYKKTFSQIGKTAINSIIINTLFPILVAYGKSIDDQAYVDRAISWIQQMSAEDNHLTKQWEVLGVSPKNAFDSQALIHLYNNYCQRRRCLECAIGNKVLNR